MHSSRPSTSIPDDSTCGLRRHPANRLTPETVRAWVEASCRAQGLPVKVADRVTIQNVAVLFGRRTDPRG